MSFFGKMFKSLGGSDRSSNPNRQVRSGAHDFLSPESMAAWSGGLSREQQARDEVSRTSDSAWSGVVTPEQQASRAKAEADQKTWGTREYAPVTPPKLESPYERYQNDVTKSKVAPESVRQEMRSRATEASVRAQKASAISIRQPE